MKKIRISLLFEIMLLCVGLVLVSSLAMRSYAYHAARNTLEYSAGQMCINITRAVGSSIDAQKFSELITAEDMDKEYYNQLRLELNEIKNNTGLKYLYTMRIDENGTCYYVVDGIELDAEGASLLGDVEEEISDLMTACLEGEEGYEFYESEEWGQLVSGYVPIKNSNGDVVGMLGADFDVEFMMKELAKTNLHMYNVGALIVLVSIVVAAGFSYLIIRSIKKLQSKVTLVQQGDLTVRVDNTRRDEVGNLAHTFQSMVDNMSSMIHNIRDNSEVVGRDIDNLYSNIDISNRATEEITKIVGEIACGATNQVENAEEVETSMNRVFTEITTIITNIDEVDKASDLSMNDMQEASDKLQGSVKQINLVNDTVETTATMMKQLEEKFKEVLIFSKSVEAIASRTDLLALNASIEAASAGVHGRGFSIVASEIKALAKQSGEASKNIQDLISAVQAQINNSSDAIEKGVVQARDSVTEMSLVEHKLEKLSNSNQNINARIKQIAKAALNIEEDSKKVLDKTTLLADIAKNLSSGTQQTSAETQEQYAIMEGIRNDLIVVKERMEQLSTTVYEFKIND